MECALSWQHLLESACFSWDVKCHLGPTDTPFYVYSVEDFLAECFPLPSLVLIWNWTKKMRENSEPTFAAPQMWGPVSNDHSRLTEETGSESSSNLAPIRLGEWRKRGMNKWMRLLPREAASCHRNNSAAFLREKKYQRIREEENG